MYILDSTVRVSLFLENDIHHKDAKILMNVINSKIFLPYCVINEVSTVLTYKHSKKQANLFLEFITDNEDIIKINNDLDSEIIFFKNINSKISFTDLSIINIAINNNLKLITFDKDMKKVYMNLN
jgi:predicted nucleic acid-binding protein